MKTNNRVLQIPSQTNEIQNFQKLNVALPENFRHTGGTTLISKNFYPLIYHLNRPDLSSEKISEQIPKMEISLACL